MGSGETVPHDLFLFGRSVTVDGVVQGDLIVGTETLVVNGTVEGDVWAAANTVEVTAVGHVLGDLRAGAQSLRVSGTVDGGVLAGAERVEVRGGARIGGDLIAYANRVTHRGEVVGDLGGETSKYTNEGAIGGRELIHVRPRGDPERPRGFGDWLLDRVQQWVSLVLAGGVMVLVWRRGVLSLGDTVVRRPIASAVGGLIVVAGGFGVSILLLIGGILTAVVLGLLGLGGLAAIAVVATVVSETLLVTAIVVGGLFVAAVVVSLLGGRKGLEGRWHGGRWEIWAWLGVGTVPFAIVLGVPVLGPLVGGVTALFGLGAMALAVQRRWSRGRSEGGEGT